MRTRVSPDVRRSPCSLPVPATSCNLSCQRFALLTKCTASSRRQAGGCFRARRLFRGDQLMPAEEKTARVRCRCESVRVRCLIISHNSCSCNYIIMTIRSVARTFACFIFYHFGFRLALLFPAQTILNLFPRCADVFILSSAKRLHVVCMPRQNIRSMSGGERPMGAFVTAMLSPAPLSCTGRPAGRGCCLPPSDESGLGLASFKGIPFSLL